MTTSIEPYVSIVETLYPLYFNGTQNAVVKKVITNLSNLHIEVTPASFTDELNRVCSSEEIAPYITSPVRKHHLYSDILKVQDRRANYVGRHFDDEGFSKWREPSLAITDEQLYTIVEEHYPGVYNTKSVVGFVLTTLFQDKQALTIEHFITQMQFLKGIKMLNNMTLAKQKEFHDAMVLNKLIYRIYEDATYETVRASDYKQFDNDIRDMFDKTIYPDLGKDRARKWIRLFDNRKSVKYPPFYVYNEPNGDVTFTRENRGIYDYKLPSPPSILKRILYKIRKSSEAKKH